MYVQKLDLKHICRMLEDSLADLNMRRRKAEDSGYTSSQIEEIDKEIEKNRNELEKTVKSIREEERRDRRATRRNARIFSDYEMLLYRLGVRIIKPDSSIEEAIAFAECLLAGFNMDNHLYNKLLHSENPDVQERARRDMRILEKYVKLCRKIQVDVNIIY